MYVGVDMIVGQIRNLCSATRGMGGRVVQKSEWTDRKVDRVRSDGHHGLIALHTLNGKVLRSAADK